MPSLHKPPKGLYYRQDCPHSIFLTDLLLGHCWKLVPRTPAVFPSGSIAVWLLPVGSLMFVTLLVIAPTSWWVNSLASIQSSVLSFHVRAVIQHQNPEQKSWGKAAHWLAHSWWTFLHSSGSATLPAAITVGKVLHYQLVNKEVLHRQASASSQFFDWGFLFSGKTLCCIIWQLKTSTLSWDWESNSVNKVELLVGKTLEMLCDLFSMLLNIFSLISFIMGLIAWLIDFGGDAC